ncbi:SEP-domain-containing protein [Obba rivulosa]|uniref:SEP-domain-containing protein n=1 Tax=Obba rivulosa TaxID=1052685 RepID=A0A8E2B123_9APHY|nr:SEP-domain-containing protein [Obba rivulosa]
MADDNSEGRSSGSRSPWNLPSNSSGPRIGRIGGWSSSSSSSSRNNSRGPRIATLRDVGSSGAPPPVGGFGGGAPGGDDDDDSDEDPSTQGESWFAGGERSGISVQNPDRPGATPGGDLVRDLLRRAAEAGPAPGAPTGPSRSSIFSGGGYTLGSDEVDSSYVPDPDAPAQEEETAVRHITFWRNGFSVEDGELMSYDNPTHAQILEEINSGRAPPQILNVSPGQPVELRVVKRLQDDYTAPPKARSAFSGAGHRLGSPIPTFANAGAGASTSADMPGSFPARPTASSAVPQREPEAITTRFEVDQSQPTTSVQVRLADGTRLVCRMNLTHTVGDIRSFVNASRPENNARPYTINLTFPNRVLEDESQTIKDAGLANSVVVQRWV